MLQHNHFSSDIRQFQLGVRLTRRELVGMGMCGLLSCRVVNAMQQDNLQEAAEILRRATATKEIRAAVLHVRDGDSTFERSFGEAKSPSAAFLLGSISKPIAITSLMVLHDRGKVQLADPVKKYIPEFTGGQRDQVTVQHLLTHVSGLPDQLPENAQLRSSHAPLSEFVKGAIKVPLNFAPGTRYDYSSMAILLATEIAQRISGVEIKELVDTTVLAPLEMTNSSLGMRRLKPEQTVPCQVEFGAVEAGGGSADSKSWDWNSPYWRALGAPWGGLHASAADVATFLDSFLHPTGKLVRPEIARLMIRNHNGTGLTSRGLGFDVGMRASCRGCSEQVFGHTGSTGTIAWADPAKNRICVVLTTLPARAMTNHPRQLASDRIAEMG